MYVYFLNFSYRKISCHAAWYLGDSYLGDSYLGDSYLDDSHLGGGHLGDRYLLLGDSSSFYPLSRVIL